MLVIMNLEHLIILSFSGLFIITVCILANRLNIAFVDKIMKCVRDQKGYISISGSHLKSILQDLT